LRFERRTIALFALALGGFGIGLTEFVTFGLLPQIAHSVSPSLYASDRGDALSHAGWTVSAYALGVVVGAPTLAVLGARMEKVKLVVLLLVGLAVGNALSAAAPNLPLLLCARFLAGLPHGAYFGVAGLLAAHLIGPEARSRGLALVLSGLTVANVIGVPSITRLGQLAGYRVAYVTITGVFLLTAALVTAFVRDQGGEETAADPRTELAALKAPAVWLACLVAAIGFAGFFAVDSYLVPITTHSAHLASSVAPWVLVVVGLGMTIGNAAGGLSADRRPNASLLGGLGVLAVVMAIFAVVAHTVVGLFLGAFAVGAAALFLGGPMQALFVRAAPSAVLIGPALTQSSMNVANAIGALAGGAVLSGGYAYTATGWVGAAFAIAGLALAIPACIKLTRPTHPAVTPAGSRS
jgi:MFS transporter, DHA1 family, inner membrane transport protein